MLVNEGWWGIEWNVIAWETILIVLRIGNGSLMIGAHKLYYIPELEPLKLNP